MCVYNIVSAPTVLLPESEFVSNAFWSLTVSNFERRIVVSTSNRLSLHHYVGRHHYVSSIAMYHVHVLVLVSVVLRSSGSIILLGCIYLSFKSHWKKPSSWLLTLTTRHNYLCACLNANVIFDFGPATIHLINICFGSECALYLLCRHFQWGNRHFQDVNYISIWPACVCHIVRKVRRDPNREKG